MRLLPVLFVLGCPTPDDKGVDDSTPGTDSQPATDCSDGYVDVDLDGYGTGDIVLICEGESGASEGGDCDDSDPQVFPGASEVCDDVDQDCDSTVDEGVVQIFWLDADSDGFGSPAESIQACVAPDGYADNDGDCNDSNNAAFPGATEVCNADDEDCDNGVDEGLAGTEELCAATSCATILLENADATDGVYWIDTADGALQTRCDMSGGGWTLAFLKNSLDEGTYADAGSGYVDVGDLRSPPDESSGDGANAVSGWLDINDFPFTALQIRAYGGGVETWASADIDPAELNIAFGQDGYLLYNDSNGYYWCAGSGSYTDAGVGQVNQPAGAPADCKGHGSLGSGWDFSQSDQYNQGLTMCGVDNGSTWMHSDFFGASVSYPNPGAAQALWLK